ncbi:MAG: hypothetical protein DI535_20195 [Citrobacter freundii]|nr:MAG: hypothetical protein DI535_20195 [Citrobacter freundii]
MSFSYDLHPLIRQDYDEGYRWYEEKQKGLGDRFLRSVRKKIGEILERPEAYGSRANKIYREARVDDFPYAVIYKLNKRKKKIYIIATDKLIYRLDIHSNKNFPAALWFRILEKERVYELTHHPEIIDKEKNM